MIAVNVYLAVRKNIWDNAFKYGMSNGSDSTGPSSWFTSHGGGRSVDRQPNQGHNLAQLYLDVLWAKAVQGLEHSKLAEFADHPPSVLPLLCMTVHEALRHTEIRPRSCQGSNRSYQR